MPAMVGQSLPPPSGDFSSAFGSLPPLSLPPLDIPSFPDLGGSSAPAPSLDNDQQASSLENLLRSGGGNQQQQVNSQFNAPPAFRSGFVMGRPGASLGNENLMGFDTSNLPPLPGAGPSGMVGGAPLDAGAGGGSMLMKERDYSRQRLEDALENFLAKAPNWRCGQRDVGRARTESPDRIIGERRQKERSKSRGREAPGGGSRRSGGNWDQGPGAEPQKPLGLKATGSPSRSKSRSRERRKRSGGGGGGREGGGRERRDRSRDRGRGRR